MSYPEQAIRLRAFFAVLAASAVLLGGTGGAQAQEELTGVRSMGMGGANRAIVTGNDAVYLNPAGMSLNKKYSLEGSYQYDFGSETHGPGASIVDSVTSPVAAGVAYGYVNGKKTLRTTAIDGTPLTNVVERTGNIVHLAISAPLGRSASVGAAAKYMDISYGGRSAINSIGVDAGLVYKVSPTVSFALTGYGLTNTGSAEQPLAMGVVLALGPPGTFQLAADWVIDFSTAKYNESIAPDKRVSATRHQIFTGFEWTIAKAFTIRAGYFHDRATRLAPDNAVTFGLGYFSLKNRLGFQVAFQQRFLNTDERIIIAGIQLFI